MGIILIAVGCFYLALAINPAMAFTLIPVTPLVGGSPLFTVFKRLAGAGLIVVSFLGYRAGQVPAIDWEPCSVQIAEKNDRRSRAARSTC